MFWDGNQTSRSKHFMAEKPISPVQSSIFLYGSSNFCKISSASFVSSSCSFVLVSDDVIFTSSTLLNWCCLIIPRVSLLADPASLLKHGVYAQYFKGSCSKGITSSLCKLVSGTSAVGTRYNNSFSHL